MSNRQRNQTDTAWVVIGMATAKMNPAELQRLADEVEREGREHGYVPHQQFMAEAAETLREWARERAAQSPDTRWVVTEESA